MTAHTTPEAPRPSDSFEERISEMRDTVLPILHRLTPLEQQVVLRRCGVHRKPDGRYYVLSEVAEDLGLTKQEVRLIETKALTLGRHPAISGTNPNMRSIMKTPAPAGNVTGTVLSDTALRAFYEKVRSSGAHSTPKKKSGRPPLFDPKTAMLRKKEQLRRAAAARHRAQLVLQHLHPEEFEALRLIAKDDIARECGPLPGDA